MKSGWLACPQWEKFENDKITAHRIYSSPKVWVERFGGDVLISQKDKISMKSLLEDLSSWGRSVDFVPRRVFSRDLVHNPDSSQKPKLLIGDRNLSSQEVIQEYGLCYGIDFDWSYSVGFFIDQRANRARVRELRPKRLLNCFAYTSSFSVVAASVGAETTSIDIAKPAIEKAKENFVLNRIDAEKHFFITDDVRDVLPRFIKKGRQFDCIVLDPPTFSRSKKGGVFNIEKEMNHLIELAFQCAAPRASILISTNCTRLSVKKLKQKIQGALKRAKKYGTIKSCSPLPDVPNDAMPSALWVSL